MNTTTNAPQQLARSVQSKKAIRYTLMVLGISWSFGFAATHLLDFSNRIIISVTMFIYGFIPAILAIILNKKHGGTWKDLNFIKASKKQVFFAVIIPFIFFITVIYTQILLDIRSNVDWSKLDSTLNIVLFTLGYPLTCALILGEEIGWRGYLQNKLINGFGAFKGIIILGLVWGFWHMPIALQGYNFPNHPFVEAFITYPLAGIALSLMIAYIGFNRYSIFIGALIHGGNNHIGSILLSITETQDEFAHAMVFNAFYEAVIIVFGYLWWRKTKLTDKLDSKPRKN